MSARTWGDLDRFQQPQASDSNLANPQQWLVDWYRGGADTDSGVAVNGTTILRSGPVFQAVSIISGDLGQLPLRVMSRQANGDTERDRTHPAHRLFSQQPNDDMLPSTFKELLQQWSLLWGNGVAAIVRIGSRPSQLVPLLPDRTEVDRDDQGQLWYVTTINDGTEKRRFRPENILHIPGLTSDGLWGLSVIELMKNSVGMGLALEKHGNKTFAKGTRLHGVLTRPVDAGKWSKEARQNLRREWREMHEGLDAKEAVAVLQDGMDFKPMSISNVDAQWVEATKLSREMVAAWFNLPPHKLGAMEQSSVRANLEEQNRDYLNTTLMRWLVKWEEECNRKLLTTRERDTETRFFKWNTSALLRGSTKDRYAAYMVGRTGGWLSPNEIRKLEDMNRREDDGGDEYGNPNTSSPAATEEPQPDQQEQVAEAHRALIAERTGMLLRVERLRIEKAAKHPGDFIGWLDSFYQEDWRSLAKEYLGPSVAAAVAVGFPASDYMKLAAQHGADSRRELFELCGVVGQKQLAAQVNQLIAQWSGRVDALVGAILSGGQIDAAA